MQKSSLLINIKIFALLILLVFIGVHSGCATINLGPRLEPFHETVLQGEGDKKVLLVDIDGAISNKEKRSLVGGQIRTGLVDRVREILRKAEEDDDIQALLLRINSPGGTVTASDIIYHQINEFKRNNKIPVYVTILDLAASGGYYIAVSGDKIFAHPTSLTGSIGVIAIKPNFQGLIEKIGVEFEVVKSGDKKDFLSPLRSLTLEERKLFQATIDDFHQRFVNVVADNRPDLDRGSVSRLADGRVYTARQALDEKLVDRIGYLDDTLEEIKKDLGLDELKVVTYHRPGEYKSNVYSSLSGPPTINLINLDLGLSFTEAPQFLYMWAP
jgi:protease-4